MFKCRSPPFFAWKQADKKEWRKLYSKRVLPLCQRTKGESSGRSVLLLLQRRSLISNNKKESFLKAIRYLLFDNWIDQGRALSSCGGLWLTPRPFCWEISVLWILGKPRKFQQEQIAKPMKNGGEWGCCFDKEQANNGSKNLERVCENMKGFFRFVFYN